MFFPSRLKELRKLRNVSQVRAGEIAGITSKQIQRYEAGESEPTLSVLLALADYFNVSLDYLVGRTDKPEVNR